MMGDADGQRQRWQLRCPSGCCAKCPLEVVVGLFAHVSIASFASARVNLWHQSRIGSQVTSGGEALDRADLAFNDNSEDICHTRKGCQQLHVGGELDALENAFFEHSDLVDDGIEEIEMLLETAACFRGKLLDGSIEPGSSFTDEYIAVLRCV